MTVNRPRWPHVASAVAASLLFAMGCDDHRLPNLTDPEMSAADLGGKWHVLAYESDQMGCTPQRAQSPFDHVVVEPDEEKNSSDSPRLDVFPCPSVETCPQQVAPENGLFWNPDHRRAEVVHHRAVVHRIGPREHRCRLSAIQTLLVPDGAELQMTRSYFETALPVHDDEACNSELAIEYRAQMPCTQSETIRLMRRDNTSD